MESNWWNTWYIEFREYSYISRSKIALKGTIKGKCKVVYFQGKGQSKMMYTVQKLAAKNFLNNPENRKA